MVSPSLPAELTAALDARLEGLSRHEAAARAARISKIYRDGGNSSTIKSEADALAYALARMPATYAAVTACLNALGEVRPEFAPENLLDVGAGSGTAVWAAAQAFASLKSFVLLDANDALRTLALDLAGGSARLADLKYEKGEARAALGQTGPADLVMASYMIGELTKREREALAEAMWARTRDTLVIVEPGTPAGYARIIAVREQLIALGADVAAPCPHQKDCPLRQPDWCHFSQRLPRSQAHKQIKGAELAFEDEKFSYVAMSRVPAARRPARVLAQPVAGKAEISAKLCTADGLVTAKVPRRDKPAYARARRWRWGGAVMDES